MSKYKVNSGPYFPVFRPEISPYLGTFHVVVLLLSVMDGKTPDQNSMETIHKSYYYQADILNLYIGMVVLEKIF